jgi:hypothetical protein
MQVDRFLFLTFQDSLKLSLEEPINSALIAVRGMKSQKVLIISEI